MMPRSILAMFDCWLTGAGKRSCIWRLLPHCVMWTLWRERNARLFENVEHPIGALSSTLLNFLFDWVVGAGLAHYTCINDLIEGCPL